MSKGTETPVEIIRYTSHWFPKKRKEHKESYLGVEGAVSILSDGAAPHSLTKKSG